MQVPDGMDTAATLRCRQDCAALYIAFANSIDFRDYDRVLSLFVPDAVIHRKGAVHAGREAIKAMLLARPPNQALRHVISNIEIVPTAPATAHGLCYFMAFLEPGADDAEYLPMRGPAVMGELHGGFRLTDEGWRFDRFDARLTYAREGI